MPTPTYTPLATVTLGSSASSVTFSSIPATYRDLVVVISCTATSNGDIGWRANGDTGSNYSAVQAGVGATTGGAFSNAPTGTTALAGSGGTVQSTSVLQLMDYSATDKHKTSLSRANQGDAFVNMAASRYASTSAITSLTLLSLTFNTGSTFSLYGIAS
jgi:hypothetical protein